MPITIKKIAELAGVSRGTVDRVINNRGNVNIKTELKIKQIIEDYEYEPNVSARVLANSKTNKKIGVVINSLENHFFDDVLLGINKATKYVKQYNIEVITKEIKGYNVDAFLKSIDSLLELNIDGLVVTPIQDQRIIQKLNSLAIKVVFINSQLNGYESFMSVVCNNYQSGQIAASLANLIVRKGSKCAIVTGSLLNYGNKERIRGFSETIEVSSIVEILENNDDDVRSYDLTSKLINSQDIDYIYFGAGGIDGGLKAIIDNKKKTKAITVDSSDLIKELIESGTVYATITQNPFEQGYRSIKELGDYLCLNKLPKHKKIYTSNTIQIRHLM